MMKSDKQIAANISRLIRKKSSSHLKISILLFVVSLVLISTASVFFINQYLQVEKDFIANHNTHTIEITSARGNAMHAVPLQFADEPILRDHISSLGSGTKYRLFKEYQFNFGIQDSEGNTHFIYGLDEDAAALLGDCSLERAVTCGQTDKGPAATLRIPVIDIHEDGLSSSRFADYTVTHNTGVAENNPFSLYNDEQLDSVYVGSATFKDMIEAAYSVSWDEFVAQYDEDNPFGIQALRKMYIYVEDLSQVEKIAELVNDKGYNTNYTFKAFDDFSQSMNNTLVLSVSLASLILIITASHVLLSFHSFLKVQQKDMGILKQFGYGNRMIQHIYAGNINRIFGQVAAGIAAYTAIICLLFVKERLLLYSFSLLFFLMIVLFIINRIIVLVIAKGYASKDILTLLKTNKEFE